MSSQISRANNNMLTIQATAELVGANPYTIRRAIAAGELKAYRLGNARAIRINPKDIDKWLNPVTSLAKNRDLKVGR